MQVIYIDVLFFLNFAMNLFIFQIAALISNKKIKKAKLVVGSVIGAAIYCLAVCWRPLQQLPMPLYYLAVPVLSILYMFKPTSLKVFLKDYLICFLAAWGVGGIGFNLYYVYLRYTGNQKASFFIPIVSGMILVSIIECALTWIRKQRINLQYEYELLLEHKGKKVVLRGFLDTGNKLYTLNHKPVTLIPLEDAQDLLPERYISVINQCEVEDPVEVLMNEKGLKCYLIPYDSVGCKGGILLGVTIEKMIVKRGTIENRIEDCVIGITPHPLFKGGEYHALIHPEFIS